MPDSFSILTVCTGSICRSPVAERLLQGNLPDAVAVSSVGVSAVVGPPGPRLARRAVARGTLPSIQRAGTDRFAEAFLRARGEISGGEQRVRAREQPQRQMQFGLDART